MFVLWGYFGFCLFYFWFLKVSDLWSLVGLSHNSNVFQQSLSGAKNLAVSWFLESWFPVCDGSLIAAFDISMEPTAMMGLMNSASKGKVKCTKDEQSFVCHFHPFILGI